MLPRGARLTRNRDFAAVYARRRRYDGVALTLSVRRHTEEELPGVGTPRLGFVVSKKTAPRAHDRNRIKRRLRAISQRHLSEWKTGVDAVFTVRREALQLSFLELETLMMQLMVRAGVSKTGDGP